MTLLALVCSFVWLGLFFKRIKAGIDWFVVFSLFSPPLHNYLPKPINMSSTVAFPFSFKEDASAYNVVESMEQVGDLASLSLN